MLLPLLLLCSPLALAPSQIATGAPGSTRTPVLADAPSIQSPIARDRAVYARHPEHKPTTGADLVVLDPKGEPLEGATVAVINDSAVAEIPGLTNVLEIAQTDATGLAELEHRSEATGIYVWKSGFPVVRIDQDRLEFHRNQAGAGSMLVGLRASTVLTGRVTIDGQPPGPDLQLQLDLPRVASWGSTAGPRILQLFGFEEPWSQGQQVRIESNGHFVIDNFLWPDTDRPATLQWNDRKLFRLPDADETPTYGDLQSASIQAPSEPIELRLARGVWTSGRITAGKLGGLDREMKLHLAFPGDRPSITRPYEIKVERTSHFLFLMPRPLRALSLELETGLESSPEERQVFEIPAPSDPTRIDWDLGDLDFDFTRARLLMVRDTLGRPLGGVSAHVLRPGSETLPPAPPRGSTQAAPSKLLVPLPAPGGKLLVSSGGFESVVLTDFRTNDGSIPVTLAAGTRLTLEADLPNWLPTEKLLVQIEADRPALQLFADQRQSYSASVRQSAGGSATAALVDATSTAAFSYTTHFASHARWPTWSPPHEGLPYLRLENFVPGVRFRLKVFEATGTVFLDRAMPAFTPGEERELRIPIDAAPLTIRGRVIGADGRPAVRANLHFGLSALAPVATTDADGAFEITTATSLDGRLMIEFASQWSACGDGGGFSGREPHAVLLDNDWHFARTGETLIQLDEPNPLEIHLADALGRQPNRSWSIELFDATGALYLDGTPWFGTPDQDLGITLDRPPGQAVWVTATLEGTTLRQLVAPDTNRIDLLTPTLGSLAIDTEGAVWKDRIDGFRLREIDTGAVLLRGSWSLPLTDIPPGTYRVQATAYEAPYNLGAPIEVTITAGKTAHIELR